MRVRRPWLALLAGVVALAPGVHAVAQTSLDKDRVDTQIRSLRDQVSEVSAEEGRLLGLIDASATRMRALDAKVASFDRQIAGVQRNLDAAQSRLAALEAQQRATEARLGEATAALAAAKGELARQAIAAYTGQTDAARYAAMLLSATSMGDLASKRSYLKAVVGSQVDAIAADERLRDQVKDLRDELELSKTEARGQRDVVEGERARLQAARDAQDGVRRLVAAELVERNRLRDEALSRKQEFQSQVAELERESAAIAEALRRRAAAGGFDRPAPGRLLDPLPGAPVTSGFGPRVHPIYGDARMHTGIDLGADTGTPIRAAGDGVVVSAGAQGAYGNATIIDHGGGLATLYAHQSSILVSGGGRVTAGQVIGRVGCTGACTGPHLHFEVRLAGDPVNPLGYL